jgi:hypothetical protein
MDLVVKPGLDPTQTLATYFTFPTASTGAPVWQNGFDEAEQRAFGWFERHYARGNMDNIQQARADEGKLLALSRQWVNLVISQVAEYENIINIVSVHIGAVVRTTSLTMARSKVERVYSRSIA